MALTLKQRKFVDAYLGIANGNATKAAELAGYVGGMDALGVTGHENLRNPKIRKEIDRYYRENAMGAEEVLTRLRDQARGAGEFMRHMDGARAYVDVEALLAAGKGHLIKGIRYTDKGQCIIEFHDAQAALRDIGRHWKLFTDVSESKMILTLDPARESLDGKLAGLAARLGEADVSSEPNG